MTSTWYGFWAEWSLRAKVTFDGANRLIIVNQGETALDFRTDIYSRWVDWMTIGDNVKFAPAMRTIGGDPIGGGQYSGIMYFLMNGWQIVVGQTVMVDGIVYHDDGIPVFVILDGGGVTNKVSSLAYAYNTAGVEVPTPFETAVAVRNELAAELANLDVSVSSRLPISAYNSPPGADAIASAVVTALLAVLPQDATPAQIATAVWEFAMNTATPGSAADRLRQTLTTPGFLALK